MGRAERRKAEKRDRIESRKGKILVSRDEINKMKNDISSEMSKYSVETLMTCFALAERQLYGFGPKRILRSLRCIDELFGKILSGEASMEDYIQEIKDETGLIIKFDDK